MSRTTLTRAIPVLFVANVTSAAAYFRDTLGFSIDFLHGQPPFYGSVSRDSACLHLKFVHESVLNVAAPDRDALIMAFVEVANVGALFAEYTDAGVTFLQTLTPQQWGRDFIVQAPDGNAICFSGRGDEAVI